MDHWKRNLDAFYEENRKEKSLFTIPFPWQPINIVRWRYRNRTLQLFQVNLSDTELETIKQIDKNVIFK